MKFACILLCSDNNASSSFQGQICQSSYLVPEPVWYLSLKKIHAPTWNNITSVVSCACIHVIKSSNKRIHGALMIDLLQGHARMFSPPTICSLCSAHQSPDYLSFTLCPVDFLQVDPGTAASALGFIQNSPRLQPGYGSVDGISCLFSICRNLSPHFCLHSSFHKGKFSKDV